MQPAVCYNNKRHLMMGQSQVQKATEASLIPKQASSLTRCAEPCSWGLEAQESAQSPTSPKYLHAVTAVRNENTAGWGLRFPGRDGEARER